jgi:hypothetical protein
VSWTIRSSLRCRDEIFLVSETSKPFLGSTRHPILWVQKARRSGVRGPGREAYSSNSSIAKIRNEWNYTSTSSVFLHDVRTDSVTLMFTAWLICRLQLG